MRKAIQRNSHMSMIGRKTVSCVICFLMISLAMSVAADFDNWLQTSKDARHSGYSPGISMYPVNEYPRPSNGFPPTYAWIADLNEPQRGGNIETHIAAWYEGTQIEDNLRVAFTTTNCNDVGAIYCVDKDGNNLDGYPIVFEDGNFDSEGDIESSIAVYYDGADQAEETRLVVACHDMQDIGGPNYMNQIRSYDLSGNRKWWGWTNQWVSLHCSPVIWIDPVWGDSNGDGHDDDFVYVFQYNDIHGTRVVAFDLTDDSNGDIIEPVYTSAWFKDLNPTTPTYSTPVICQVPWDNYSGYDTNMFFFVDESEWSNNLQRYIKVGSRAISIDINPYNRQVGVSTYKTVFNVELPYYATIPIPPYEVHDMHLSVNMNPAAVHMTEDYNGEDNDWWGYVFGIADGSNGTGTDIIFMDKKGIISAQHDLSYPTIKYGAAQQIQTNPLVIGSPAVKDSPSPYMEEIYVLYHDRATGCMGTTYFKDITVINTNQIYLAPIFLPNDEYKPLSPVITDEFLYVGCNQPVEAPYSYHGGLVYINLETIRANTSVGFFHTLPYSLGECFAQYHWNATPALIQTNAPNQYLYMGVSDINLYGGALWRLST